MVIERQKFTNISIITSIIIANLLIAFATYKQIIIKQPIGTHPAPNVILVAIFATTFAILVLLLVAHLEVKFSEENINISYFPVTKREIKRKEIKSIKYVQFKAYKQFGGIGVRWIEGGVAYLMNGNEGLCITLKSGEKIIIGIKDKNKYQTLIATQQEDFDEQ